jgi:hypothetical protein
MNVTPDSSKLTSPPSVSTMAASSEVAAVGVDLSGDHQFVVHHVDAQAGTIADHDVLR